MKLNIADVIDNVIKEAQEDIDVYLKSDVPLECYRQDIDIKLTKCRLEVSKLIQEEFIRIEEINKDTLQRLDAIHEILNKLKKLL